MIAAEVFKQSVGKKKPIKKPKKKKASK